MPRKKKERTTHWLRPNHGSAVPRNLVFVDVKAETRAEAGKPGAYLSRLDFGVAHSVRWQNDQIERWQKLVFNSAAQFWTWFQTRHRANISMWIIGYKIAQIFTLISGWDQVDSGFYSLTSRPTGGKELARDEADTPEAASGWFVDSDPPTIILLHHKGCVVHVVDIRNYANLELDEIGACVGENIPENPGRDGSYSAWENYINCRAIAVREWFLRLVEWWKREDLGQWRHTIGALSMGSFRHKFMRSQILIHNCAEALELEREALVGGEFRSFFCGKVEPFLSSAATVQAKTRRRPIPIRSGPVYVYDVNSLYPAVMRSGLFPRELAAWKETGSIDDLQSWRAHLSLIARVRVESPDCAYPIVYDRERFWANGAFWTTLCGPELLAALDAGHVKSVGRIAAYYHGRLFTDFVDFFHARRVAAIMDGKAALEKYCKLILNSLAGKWGQRSHLWEFVNESAPAGMRYGTFPSINDDGEITNYRVISGYVQQEQLLGEALESAPAIEAFVNAYGRAFMATVRKAVGEEHIFYQASDALHVDEIGHENLRPFVETVRAELGKFALVGKFNRGEYRGPHDYTLDEKVVVAGRKCRESATRKGGYEQLEEETLKSVILREPGGFLRTRLVRKKWGGFHPKGLWLPDGRVIPAHFQEGALRVGVLTEPRSAAAPGRKCR